MKFLAITEAAASIDLPRLLAAKMLYRKRNKSIKAHQKGTRPLYGHPVQIFSALMAIGSNDDEDDDNKNIGRMKIVYIIKKILVTKSKISVQLHLELSKSERTQRGREIIHTHTEGKRKNEKEIPESKRAQELRYLLPHTQAN